METKIKRPKVKKVKTERFLVKTKGYSETFESKESAKKQFEILKKRGIKNQENIKIQMFRVDNGKEGLLDHVDIKEDFYKD